jgi:hypothetical protein
MTDSNELLELELLEEVLTTIITSNHYLDLTPRFEIKIKFSDVFVLCRLCLL